MSVTNDQTKQLKYYNLAEIEKFLAEYQEWYNNQQVATADSGSNPGTPPPPPPGSNP